MIVKEHRASDGKIVIAICDSKLIGKKFSENGLQLDLCSSFYAGEEKSEEELSRVTKKSCHLNVVGTDSVDFCAKEGLIAKENVKKIKNIPYAQSIIE